MRRFTALLLALVMTVCAVPCAAAGGFSDVPDGSWAAGAIDEAVSLGLMEGMGGGEFGYGQPVKRCEFATILCRMFGWEAVSPETPSFTDAAPGAWYYSAVETAAANGAVDPGGQFRPEEAITRAEMAVMFVRALGYAPLAEKAERVAEPPFSDVTEDVGYITVASDIGMINGVGGGEFDPDGTALREHLAAMMARIYPVMSGETAWTHAFYAISSYPQRELTRGMDAVTAGWSRMVVEDGAARLDTSDGDWRIPDSYEDILDYLDEGDTPLKLGVYMGPEYAEILTDPELRTQAAGAICSELGREYAEFGANPYSGVTIDFEGLSGEAQREGFSAFLRELRDAMDSELTLYVMVQPVAEGGYFDGFDYRAIGEAADKVILMAHDYNATDLSGFEGTEYYKTAAGAPIADVYYSLRELTDPDTGVADRSKLALAVSFGNLAWQIDENGALVSPYPARPSTATVEQRLAQPDTVTGWSDEFAMPWADYTTESGSRWFLWHEDAGSVSAKLRLARLMGVGGVSFWRLGEMPEGVK